MMSAYKPRLGVFELTKGRKMRFALVRNGERGVVDDDIYRTFRIR